MMYCVRLQCIVQGWVQGSLGYKQDFVLVIELKIDIRFVLSVQKEVGDRKIVVFYVFLFLMESVCGECVGRKGERKFKKRERRGGDREVQWFCQWLIKGEGQGEAKGF